MAELAKFAFVGLANIVGKGEYAGYHHLLHFLQCFQKASFQGLLKLGLVGQRFQYVS